jgi:ABC-type multidrug transport system fused ATPase/permease subunit
MKLTENQKENIHQHLVEWNELKDEELIEELNDHYVTCIESKLDEGKAFEDAKKEIYMSFGGMWGIKKMEEKRQSDRNDKVYKIFKSTFLSYFNSPKMFIFIVLGGLSMFLTNNNLIALGKFANLILLVVILVYSFFINVKKIKDYKKNYFVTQLINIPFAILMISNLFAPIKDMNINPLIVIFVWFVMLFYYIVALETIFNYYKKYKFSFR